MLESNFLGVNVLQIEVSELKPFAAAYLHFHRLDLLGVFFCGCWRLDIDAMLQE